MKPLVHIRIVIAALVVITLTLASSHGGVAADTGQTRYLVGVSGMVCPTSCTVNVREALKTMPEVEDVAIDFAAKTATITTRASQVLTRDQVHKVLKGSGFGVITFELQPGS